MVPCILEAILRRLAITEKTQLLLVQSLTLCLVQWKNSTAPIGTAVKVHRHRDQSTLFLRCRTLAHTRSESLLALT